MTHQSENSHPLKVTTIEVECTDDLTRLDSSSPGVWLFILPFDSSRDKVRLSELHKGLRSFLEHANKETVVCFLTSSQTACDMLPVLQRQLHYKLWVAVKYDHPIELKGKLPNHHCSLLILTKYKDNLKHTKTRIAYTFCPFCDKTTKDYGGKKHTYHQYGTLMSDVWRDITVAPQEYPDSVIERLKDVFGLPPYEQVSVVDMRELIPYEKSIATAHTFDLAGPELIDTMFHNVLLNGDSLEVLGNIPSNSVDFCFADPPYNLRKKYENWDDGLDVRDYFKWCDEWLYELARVLKPSRTVAILNIPLWTARHYAYLKTILDYQGYIVWEGLSLPVRMIMPANYGILCFSKGKPRPLCIERNDRLLATKEFYCTRNTCTRYRQRASDPDSERITDLWWDIHRLKHNSRRVDHPCQLPPSLMLRLISLFTEEHETVLDPFNGVGTTTLSAQKLTRNFIGIELSEYYHKIAEARHRELSAGLDPFRKNASIPTAKNSPVPRLKKQTYSVSKKTLQLDVRRIANDIGKLPNRGEVEKLSRYPIELFDDYFISWGEVCAAARTTGMTETRNPESSPRSSKQLTLF
jgi:site-specific DNA-methyltransferase (adenine-specific)